MVTPFLPCYYDSWLYFGCSTCKQVDFYEAFLFWLHYVSNQISWVPKILQKSQKSASLFSTSYRGFNPWSLDCKVWKWTTIALLDSYPFKYSLTVVLNLGQSRGHMVAADFRQDAVIVTLLACNFQQLWPTVVSTELVPVLTSEKWMK